MHPIHKHAKKVWKFFWHEDSIASWIANIVVAFLVIYFIVYPVLGAVLGTSFPIVAVISESMDHSNANEQLCGLRLDEFKDSFDNYWDVCGSWYETRGISKDQFKGFPFPKGFSKGDVIILWRPTNIKVGDILIFQGSKPQPIIHRVVKIDDGFYQTKGDHNSNSITGPDGETRISQDRIYGKGIIRLPYLGWVKILFVDAVRPLGINIVR